MERVTITQFTDPICIWCWGNEPVIRAIDYLYADKVKVEYVMGGLVEDITTLFDLRGNKTDIIKRANAIIANNWLAASQRHGMPVETKGMELFSERYPSSFPQNVAYEAARLINPTLADKFLRDLREATFTLSQRTSQIDVLLDIATKTGYNPTDFIDEYTTGSAHSNFMQDRTLCRRHGITGFPSYSIHNDDTNIIIGGYQNLPTFHTIISRLSKGRIKPRRVGPSLANVLEFVAHYQRVYPIEIEVTFSLNRHQCALMVEQLISSNLLLAQPIGNGTRLSINTETYNPLHRRKNHRQPSSNNQKKPQQSDNKK